ncbi:MAG: LysM peptidoglycan-binding domain-containing protein [Pleurocapsa minor GSE-CHR-MK-17-07R]|jgi:LysM repeat protein|nr:LysM peptidoglycan-binding domain-containing protein [Pleurocapsa minor GSE-CHR-MK 17-07R]
MMRHPLKPLRTITLAASLFMATTLAACFTPAGNSLESTSVAFSQATFTDIPTETPLPPPTEEQLLPSDTPLPTDTPEPAVIEMIAITNTPDPLALALTNVAVAAIITPTPDPLQVVQADPLVMTATALANLALGAQVQPDIFQIDPLAQTATALAIGAGVIVEQPIDPLALTATAFIAGATQTAAYPMTQTMEAILGPTATIFNPLQPTITPPIITNPGTTCTHTVVAGDNMFRISLRYNTTVNAIASANGIVNPALIIVGQVLNIPGCGGTSGTGAPITANSSGGTSSCAGQQYTVQQNETLFQISLRYNVPVNSIASCNGISNINLIFINQVITIPAA